MYYYVYEWYVIETGEIIYVGKGSKNRYKVRKHNKLFNEIIKKYECSSRIIQEFETEEAAFKYERERVDELHALGQCKCNLHNGGYGGTTEWWTTELRELYSKNNIMKSPSQKERMSIHNPMKDKKVAQKANNSKKRAVIVNGYEYSSVKEVCEKYGVSTSTVQGWCSNGHTPDGETCNYKDTPITSNYVPPNKGNKYGVTYKDKHYESATAMAKELGLSQTSVSRWCRAGRDTWGNSCRYDGDTREIVTPISHKHIPIIVNGVKYESKQHASRALGISAYILTQYLNKTKNDNTYICEYDNQQPSQGNTDNSTLEGSETNG